MSLMFAQRSGPTLFATVFALSTLMGGCASTPWSALPTSLPSPADSTRACVGWLQRLDANVDASGVRDVEAHRLPGYPHLRSNRLLASFAPDVALDRAKFPDWITEMRELDQRSRDIEIDNLPEASVYSLGQPSKRAVRAEIRRCGEELLARDISATAYATANATDSLEKLGVAAQVPDNYSSTLRAFGLYPLTSIAFFAGVNRWQVDTANSFSQPRPTNLNSVKVLRYIPPATGKVTTAPDDSISLLIAIRKNALGIPQLSEADRNHLLTTFAPIFDIETRRKDDQIGRLLWEPDGMLQVITGQPTVYRRVAFTRIGTNVLTQLIYSAWFPRRTSFGAFDLLAGELDSVIWRITLDANSRPLIADSIHACGCYHLFFPGSQMQMRPAPDARMEWAFAPVSLPPLSPGSRFTLRLASGSHYLIGVTSGPALGGITYTSADDDGLRALSTDPTADASRSIYGPDGLVAGSKRSERFLFWPMGIASAGAMRQWGRHATAFVGRRHFDDATLIERRFEIADKPMNQTTPH